MSSHLNSARNTNQLDRSVLSNTSRQYRSWKNFRFSIQNTTYNKIDDLNAMLIFMSDIKRVAIVGDEDADYLFLKKILGSVEK